MKEHKVIAALVVLVFFLFMAFQLNDRAESAEQGKWINIALSGSPGTFKPWEVTDAVSSSILHNNVYECLFAYGDDWQKVVPWLVREWRVKDAGQSWVFYIKENIHFHDGSIMTARDVAESFERNPRFTGRVRVLAEDVVEVNLPEKRANFLESLTQIHYSVTKVTADGKVLGTGPFVIEKWRPEHEVVLKVFPDYWNGGQYIVGARFLCSVDSLEAIMKLKSGKVDIVDVVQPEFISELENDKDIVVSTMKGVNLCFVHINASRPPLDSAEFRKALNMAIDKKNLIREVFRNQAMECNSLIPRAIGGTNSPSALTEFNISRAREVIKRHLAGQNRTFTMVGLPFPRPYCPNPQTMARLIAGYLRSAGLKIKYIPTHSFEDYDRYIMGDDFDFVLAGWIIDSRDPDDFLTTLFGIGNVPELFAHVWKNEEFDSLVLKARGTVSLKSRWALYNKAVELFYEASPWIMIASTSQIGAYRSTIYGFKFSPTGELRLRGVKKVE